MYKLQFKINALRARSLLPFMPHTWQTKSHRNKHNAMLCFDVYLIRIYHATAMKMRWCKPLKWLKTFRDASFGFFLAALRLYKFFFSFLYYFANFRSIGNTWFDELFLLCLFTVFTRDGNFIHCFLLQKRTKVCLRSLQFKENSFCKIVFWERCARSIHPLESINSNWWCSIQNRLCLYPAKTKQRKNVMNTTTAATSTMF